MTQPLAPGAARAARFRVPRACVALLAVIVGSLAAAAHADTVNVVSSRDNTLYESSAGNVSNGAGDGMFAGRTAQASNSRRRGLARFDVAAAIPAGSTVTGVQLQLFCTTSASGGATSTELHRVLADWGEGASNAGAPGGGGAPAAVGDATWRFRFYNTLAWVAPGGDYSGAASGGIVATPLGPCTIGSTPAMVADVQAWLDTPADNFGWLLLGDESVAATANRFETHEAGGTGVPTLVVTYDPPATPARAATWGRVKGAYR